MKIIGHRGAAGLALENTKESFSLARFYGVDAIEIDVRLTSDNKLAVVHDKKTARLAETDLKVKHHTMAELRSLTLHNGERILTLQEVLANRQGVPLIIEIKSASTAEPVLRVINGSKDISLASFNIDELRMARQLNPDIPLYLLERQNPIEVLQRAAVVGANGIGLNHWLINPLTYWLARRQKLEIYVYTVNYPIVAWFLRLLYPKLAICTDYPNRYRPRKRNVKPKSTR